jgi:hypothetical protein
VPRSLSVSGNAASVRDPPHKPSSPRDGLLSKVVGMDAAGQLTQHTEGTSAAASRPVTHRNEKTNVHLRSLKPPEFECEDRNNTTAAQSRKGNQHTQTTTNGPPLSGGGTGAKSEPNNNVNGVVGHDEMLLADQCPSVELSAPDASRSVSMPSRSEQLIEATVHHAECNSPGTDDAQYNSLGSDSSIPPPSSVAPLLLDPHGQDSQEYCPISQPVPSPSPSSSDEGPISQPPLSISDSDVTILDLSLPPAPLSQELSAAQQQNKEAKEVERDNESTVGEPKKQTPRGPTEPND